MFARILQQVYFGSLQATCVVADDVVMAMCFDFLLHAVTVTVATPGTVVTVRQGYTLLAL